MAVLGFDDLALMLFYFGRGGFENFHIDNVVSTIDAVRLVTTDEHPDFLRDALSRHIANTRPTQIVKLQPNVLCFFLRFARCAFTSLGYVRAAISTFKSTQPCANTSVPPSLPKILNSTSIIACEHKIVGPFASNTAHEALKDVLRHVNHSLIAVLCFAEVNDLSQ
jgi:hypothetical protein